VRDEDLKNPWENSHLLFGQAVLGLVLSNVKTQTIPVSTTADMEKHKQGQF
jgi:hypothetical protein